MNKERSLTWEYFWQQKFKEVSIFLLCSFVIIFIPYWFGKLLIKIGLYIPYEMNFELWAMGLISLLFSLFILGIIFLGLHEWLSGNWEKAKRRAKKELRKK